jgi:UDP-N-acetylmuramate--alanine ligase
VVVFQPHLYSRTREFTTEFASALARADRALVLPIYPSREDPIPGVTSQGIVEAAAPEAEGRIRAATPEEVVDPERFPAGGDRPTVVAFMGAGDVTEMARALVRRLGAS